VYIAVANTCTSNVYPVMRSVSLVGTISTVCLLVALAYAELSALLEGNDASAAGGATEEAISGVHDPGEVLARLRVESVQANYLLDQRVYWTDIVACLKTLGIFG
jgi:hypothetical protein